jgi:APA family basic amino acid/polyamine antiporter
VSITSKRPAEPGSAGLDPGTGFERRLGLFDSTMLVAGTMIGSGIFIVSADIARDVGSSGWLLAIWVLTGVITVLGALSYAELAAMMPHAGGQYVYLREAFSPLWGFLYGWAVFLVIQTGTIAAVGVAFAKFLGILVPWLGTEQEVWKYTFAEPVVLRLPHWLLPWLAEPLTVLKRDKFTISAGQLVAVGVTVVLTALNCRGVQEGKWVQNVFTVAKTLALIVLIVLGLTVAANAAAIQFNTTEPNVWQGASSTPRFAEVSRQLAGASALLVALMVAGGAMTGALFSADAWNNITFTAGEVRNPRRNLPLSLIFGAGMVIVLYVVANVAYLAALPTRNPALEERLQAFDERAAELEKKGQAEEANKLREVRDGLLKQSSTFDRGIANARDDRVGTAVMELASPNLGVAFMAVAIMISTFGCVNGVILMGARLYYAMARDGLFFQTVGTLNRRHVPAAGLILQGAWSVLLIFSGTYTELLDLIMFAALFFYVLTVAGLFVLRRTRPDAERPYRVHGYPVVPGLYVLLCALIMLDLLIVRPEYTWPGLIIVLSGIPVYFFWRWKYPPLTT